MALEKKLNCPFIRISTSKKNHDANYEASIIQTFISIFDKNKMKKLEDKIKNLSIKNNANDIQVIHFQKIKMCYLFD